MDTITDILARPGEAARQLTEMRAALAAVTARLAAVTEERDGMEDVMEEHRRAVADMGELAKQYNAEVMRRTTIMQSVAQKIEWWIHDTDQFSPRTSAEDMVVQDGQLEELAQIVKALRGDTAPAGRE